MFTGSYENSLDNKNRMIIPSKFRGDLGECCMLAQGYDKCLYIYTMEYWDVIVEKMMKLKQTDRDIRKFIRNYFSNATKCQIDSQGRILVPQNLKKYAMIDKDLVTLGAMDKIEVWSREVLNDPLEENMFDNDEFVAKLEAYDI